MAKKKVSFRGVPAAEVTARYHKCTLMFLLLHIIACLAVPAFLLLALLGRMSWFNGIFCAFTSLVLNWLIAAFRKFKLAEFSAVLNSDCDPVKLEKVFAPLDKTPQKFNDITLNMIRALFYQGRWEEALERLQQVEKPKEKTPMYFQYYNMLSCCYEQAKDLEKLMAIQRKMQTAVNQLKPKSPHIGNGRQLLTILDIMIAQLEGRISYCKTACKELYDQASFALSRINVSLRLAQLEHLSGANHSAVTRCEYIIDDGGTTFYAEEARKLYVLCCGKDYVPEDERHTLPETLQDPDEDEWEDEDDWDDEDDESEEEESSGDEPDEEE